MYSQQPHLRNPRIPVCRFVCSARVYLICRARIIQAVVSYPARHILVVYSGFTHAPPRPTSTGSAHVQTHSALPALCNAGCNLSCHPVNVSRYSRSVVFSCMQQFLLVHVACVPPRHVHSCIVPVQKQLPGWTPISYSSCTLRTRLCVCFHHVQA